LSKRDSAVLSAGTLSHAFASPYYICTVSTVIPGCAQATPTSATVPQATLSHGLFCNAGVPPAFFFALISTRTSGHTPSSSSQSFSAESSILVTVGRASQASVKQTTNVHRRPKTALRGPF
jgi:hypothetical protein